MKVSRLVDFFDQHYPFALAEEWDNVGLVVGDPGAEVQGVFMAVDVTHDVLQQAHEAGCNVLVTHHPVIFKPVQKLNTAELQGGLVARAIRDGCALVSLHTNLDSAKGGLNDTLCSLLGLIETRPLVDSGRERFFKLAVFAPQTHADAVREALFAAGAGHVGNYDLCSFNTEGTGTFRGEEGKTDPFLGKPGVLERAAEVKIEVILRREMAGRVVGAMLGAHPYEEVAYDLVPLANKEGTTGLARIGRLPSPVTLEQFAAVVQQAGILVKAVLGEPGAKVSRVALCSGAGSDFTTRALSAGADVYLTAEVKHHHALAAAYKGMAMVEAGHGSLEQAHWPRLQELLKQHFPELKTKVDERGPELWRRP
ncbi:MAG: Nif3-like dinuclear metal center hexameric protein [Planctomycetes bacterium]|nr:Nif3-like dinuclear metal center hexameric protein [Planctomycetota bacterium]